MRGRVSLFDRVECCRVFFNRVFWRMLGSCSLDGRLSGGGSEV